MRARPCRRNALTLVELAVATAVTAVLVFICMVSWEMSRREMTIASVRALNSRNASGALQRIREEVMRASKITVPDPQNAALPSMQVEVPVTGGTVRRAFRLVNNELIVDLKDEGVSPYPAFTDLQALTFAVTDPPGNTKVRIVCTAARHGRQPVVMETLVTKRN